MEVHSLDFTGEFQDARARRWQIRVSKRHGDRVLRRVWFGIYVSVFLHSPHTRSSILSPSPETTGASQHVVYLLKQEQILFHIISTENHKFKIAWGDLVYPDHIAFRA